MELGVMVGALVDGLGLSAWIFVVTLVEMCIRDRSRRISTLHAVSFRLAVNCRFPRTVYMGAF